MKTTYLIIITAAALIQSATHSEGQESLARASEPASVRPASAPTDAGAGGEIAGRVILDGQAPKSHAISMAADPECSKSHPGAEMSEEVVVGPENALANVVVYISEGLDGRAFDSPKQPVVIEQKGCQYHPHVVAIEAGQKLEVENDDATTHNIHPIPLNNREWNQSQAQGVPPFEATFGREEISIPVKCNIHPWMKGYIAVFKHPYFAVTGKDGKFVLRNVPAGNYTIMVWQEKLGTQTQKISLNAKETKNLEFTFRP